MSEVDLGVGHHALLEHVVDDLALGLEGVLGDRHELLQAGEEVLLRGRLERGPVEVDRDDADGAGRIAGAPDAPRPAHELALVEVEPAAHGPDVAGVHFRADVVLEVGDAVLGRGVEEELGLGRIPIELLAEVVGRDGEGEDAALEVALDHDLEEGPVDPVDLLLVVAVTGVELHAADDGLLVLHVLGDGPVEGQVGEGRLPAPAAGDVEAEDELLHVLLDVLVAEVVVADEGGEEGVDAQEGRRRTRPASSRCS